MANPSYFPDGDAGTLAEQIARLPHGENDIVLLLVGEHSTFDLAALLAALRERKIPVAGGVFPGVIFGECKHDAGIVADVLPLAAAPSVVKGLEKSSFRLGDLPKFAKDQPYTALALVDGLTKHAALFLERLFRVYGNQLSYIGGGAGSLSFQQKPCVFDSHGLYQDAALVVWLKASAGLGVRHGWQHLRGPLVATRTQGTLVQKLNDETAFEVYNRIVSVEAKTRLTKENFFSIAKQYPLGIYHPGMDHIVRDPITFNDEGALVCVGEVPANALLYILRGEKHSLVEHAQMATHEAMKSQPDSQHTLIVDCISRVLYLEDDYSKELQAVQAALPQPASTPYGVLSLGEIATYKTGRVEFFNKTFVVGALHDLN